MKNEISSDNLYRKSEDLSSWIKKYEDYCVNNADLNEEIKEFVEFTMKECSKERQEFHDNYLYNLDNNLNVLSSKKNYQYLDFFKSPDPCAPFEKDLFKKKTKFKN